MEKKNVLHTEKVISKNKTYFLDLKEAENGNNFLVINQTKTGEDGVTERVKLILFEEDLERFSQAMMKIIFHFQKKNEGGVNKEYLAEVRKKYPNAFQRWSKEDEALLRELYQQGHQVPELMTHFQRNQRGIESRLEKLGLELFSSSAA